MKKSAFYRLLPAHFRPCPPKPEPTDGSMSDAIKILYMFLFICVIKALGDGRRGQRIEKKCLNDFEKKCLNDFEKKCLNDFEKKCLNTFSRA